MPKRPKVSPEMWLYTTPKSIKLKVPEDLETQVMKKAEELLEQWRPEHIKQPPEGYQYNSLSNSTPRGFAVTFIFALNMPALALLPYHHFLNRVLLVWSMWAMGGSI